ncbi:MAG: hypothetical protein ACM3U0_00315 [archaeon]
MHENDSFFDLFDQGYRQYLLSTDPSDRADGLAFIITAFHETALKEARLMGRKPPDPQRFTKKWLEEHGANFDESVIEAALEEGLI